MTERLGVYYWPWRLFQSPFLYWFLMLWAMISQALLPPFTLISLFSVCFSLSLCCTFYLASIYIFCLFWSCSCDCISDTVLSTWMFVSFSLTAKYISKNFFFFLGKPRGRNRLSTWVENYVNHLFVNKERLPCFSVLSSRG